MAEEKKKCKCNECDLQKVCGGASGGGGVEYYCPVCHAVKGLGQWEFLGATRVCSKCGTELIEIPK